MRALTATLLALALAGCTGANQSPLQRDLMALSELPVRFDTFLRENSAARERRTPLAETDAAGEVTGSIAPPKPKQGVYDLIAGPIPVDNPLVRPPWEVFVEAGPNAHNELDLETLYGPGNIPPELLAKDQTAEKDVALADPPDLSGLSQGQPKKAAKPGDVQIKAVAVLAVNGARGKGNAELTAAMRTALEAAGWPVLTAPREDALTIQGRVTMGKPQGANQSIKIVWDVVAPGGKGLGDLKQDNAVPAGTLDVAWGENAQYAADAAAEGIFKLIQNYR